MYDDELIGLLKDAIIHLQSLSSRPAISLLNEIKKTINDRHKASFGHDDPELTSEKRAKDHV